MVQLIVGAKGKGKTKQLLDKVNSEIRTATGSIVYLDKSAKHMYELNNKVRLIDTSEFPLRDTSEFIGFISGVISQDHDLEQMYLDSFLKIAMLEGAEPAELSRTVAELHDIGEKFKITFTLSVSKNEADLPEDVRQYVTISL